MLHMVLTVLNEGMTLEKKYTGEKKIRWKILLGSLVSWSFGPPGPPGPLVLLVLWSLSTPLLHV